MEWVDRSFSFTSCKYSEYRKLSIIIMETNLQHKHLHLQVETEFDKSLSILAVCSTTVRQVVNETELDKRLSILVASTPLLFAKQRMKANLTKGFPYWSPSLERVDTCARVAQPPVIG